MNRLRSSLLTSGSSRVQRVVISLVARTRASNEAIVGSSNVFPMSPTRVHPTSQPIPPQCLPPRFLCLPKCLPQCLPQLLRHQPLHIIIVIISIITNFKPIIGNATMLANSVIVGKTPSSSSFLLHQMKQYDIG